MRTNFYKLVFLAIILFSFSGTDAGYIFSSSLPGSYDLKVLNDPQKNKCEVFDVVFEFKPHSNEIPLQHTVTTGIPVTLTEYKDKAVLEGFKINYFSDIYLGGKKFQIYTGRKYNNEDDILTYYYGIDIDEDGMLTEGEYKTRKLPYHPEHNSNAYTVTINNGFFLLNIPFLINGNNVPQNITIYLTTMAGFITETKVWLEVNTFFTGKIDLSDHNFINIAVMDANQNGYFNDPRDLLLADTNKDSCFQIREASKLNKVFKIGDEKYRFALDGPYPTKITIEPVPAK